MLVKIEGAQVECGEYGKLRGREVAQMGIVNGAVAKPAEGETWIVVNDYHGDHDTDWVAVFKGGAETMRMRLESPAVIEVIWKEPIA